MASKSNLSLRKAYVQELDQIDKMFVLVTPTGKAYVTIVQALGYDSSKVKIHNVFEGNIGGVVGEFTETKNDQLHIVQM